MEYMIETATEKNAEEVLKIYRSLMGKDGCTWNSDYPNIDDIKNDIDQKSLYILLEHHKIIAAAAAGKDDELNALDSYSKDIKAPCYLARFAVKTEYQNRGIAKYFIAYIEKQAVKRGFDGIRFLVSKTNPHAIAVYDKMNYVCCGECMLYNQDWYCYEKKLSLI